GGAACSDPWSAAPAVAAQPEIGDARTSSGAASDAGAPAAGGGGGSTVFVQPRGQPDAAADNKGPRPPAPHRAVLVAPLPPEGAPTDPGAWKYIVTDGPKGPVVTVAPAR